MTTFIPDEHKGRQKSLAANLCSDGLQGVVVVSRGGSTLDRYADVLYLTGFYQSYSYLPDTPNLFSGRAHTAFVMTADGASILCVAVKEFEPGTVTAGDIRCSDDFTSTIAQALNELGLNSGIVGLIGADVLPYSQSRSLAQKLPDLIWQDCDELLQSIRRIKSPAELAIIRRVAKLHVSCLSALEEAIAPGMTEAELFAVFGSHALRGGAGLYFTAMSSGVNIANWCSKPLPGFSNRQIIAGEMIRFDMGIVLDGYLSDFGRTAVVGQPNIEQSRLLDTLHAGLDAVIDAIAPGRAVHELVEIGEEALRTLGVAKKQGGAGIIHSSFPVHWGHGLGMGWERPIMTDTENMIIKSGMYLAIERTLTLPGTGTAAAEQTLLVTDTGTEILSAGPHGRWL